MIPANFNYHKATSLKEAIALSQKLGEEAKYMSGGHSLLPMMKLRFATPDHIIDIAHGDAANDQPALMLALRATIIAEGVDGTKSIPIDEFFHGFYMTALEPGDILTEIQIPKNKKNSGGAYHKVERKVGDYATAGVAVHIELDNNGICKEIGIGLTNVSAVPMRLERGEAVLRGNKITDELIEKVGMIASEDCEPESDLRGSEAYKRSIVNTITKRMLNKALDRARK